MDASSPTRSLNAERPVFYPDHHGPDADWPNLCQLGPDFIRRAIRFPKLKELEAARTNHSRAMPPRTLVLSMNDGVVYGAAAQSAGEFEFMSKGESVDALPRLLHRLVVRQDHCREMLP